MDVERLIGGNRPGRRRPDHSGGRFIERIQSEGLCQCAGVRVADREGDINRGRLLVGVFNLRFGERRSAIEAPVHRLQPLENIATLHHFGQRAEFVRLVGEIHREIGIVPVAEHTEADEISLLDVHLLRRVSAAKRAHLGGRQMLAVSHLHLVLDGQTVAIPTRHIRRVEPGQRFGADDDVFQDFIERVPEVQIAVGVGRAIVQDEFWPSGAGCADSLVELVLLPGGNPARLAARQIAAHGEGRIGQIQRFSIMCHGLIPGF